jgi:ABC-type glutathione transport system ATPase component
VVASCERIVCDPARLQAGTRSTPAGENVLLIVDGLNVSYCLPHETIHCALRDVSFRIFAGEGVGVLGESGAGKSTLALALMRLLPANARVTKGSIRLSGRDILNLDEGELQKLRASQMASIFQEPAAALNPTMRVGEQISEVVRAHRSWDRKGRRRVAEEILRQVHLPEARQVYSCYPHELSGGEQQRVAIGQALVCQPALLIADEPASALDMTCWADVLACLKDAKARLNMAILMITHDPTTLVDLADRVLVLHKGELVEETTVARVLDQPIRAFRKAAPSAFTVTPGSYSAASWKPALQSHAPPGGLLRTPGESQAPCSTSDEGHSGLLVGNQLYKRYEKRHWVTGAVTQTVEALRSASLVLPTNRITCLVGESGSGKSTLARCLSAMERPDAGELYYDGCDLLRLSSSELRRTRRSIQLVLQNTAAAFSPSLTLEQTVTEPLKFVEFRQADRRDRAVALMEKVGLPERWRRRKPQELSGGQRQRLAIARALAAEPSVLIFDEALNGLDQVVQAEMLDLLLKLRESLSLAYLFITHNLDLVRFIADDVAVMHSGRIVEHGSPAVILCRQSDRLIRCNSVTE